MGFEDWLDVTEIEEGDFLPWMAGGAEVEEVERRGYAVVLHVACEDGMVRVTFDPDTEANVMVRRP